MDEVVGKMPLVKVNLENWVTPTNVKLADESFLESSEIDMLLGAEVFYEVLLPGKIKCGVGEPILVNTELGWIASGRIDVNSVKCFVSLCACSKSEEHEISKMWELDDMGINKRPSKEELNCERHFVENTYRKKNGQYVVRLPFKNSDDVLGESSKAAVSRFKNIEKRLDSDKNLKDSYFKFMSEYKDLKHMSKVDKPKPGEAYFLLPHHPVFKNESTTTKVRVVFDGSSKTSTNISLNDLLMVGATIQDELFEIILRFRKYLVALCADLEKMFRMIEVNELDRRFQMVLWYDGDGNEINYYELNTVTYGTSAATFLSTRVLSQLASDEKDNFPLAAKAISNFYVDDFIGGADSVEEARILQRELIEMFRSAKINLRK
jgi:hypothetical protein